MNLGRKRRISLQPSIPVKSCLRKDEKKETPNGKKKVVFASLEIVEFLIEIGDNPSCKDGAPLCLAPECQDRHTKDIDEYELFRQTRRHRRELVLSPGRRSKM